MQSSNVYVHMLRPSFNYYSLFHLSIVAGFLYSPMYVIMSSSRLFFSFLKISTQTRGADERLYEQNDSGETVSLNKAEDTDNPKPREAFRPQGGVRCNESASHSHLRIRSGTFFTLDDGTVMTKRRLLTPTAICPS